MKCDFEYLIPTAYGKVRVEVVSENRVRKLLSLHGASRNVDNAIKRMRANPYGVIQCGEGSVRYAPKGVLG